MPDGALIGRVGLFAIDWSRREGELGILIGRDHWGKGYGREVARTMLRYGFDTLNLNRIYLRVNADNERGIKAYEAAGFEREGVLRSHMFVEGKYIDMVMMGVLRDEWRRE